MFYDDSAEYPMDSFRLLRFNGCLKWNLFEKAVRAVLDVNPLLRSIIKRSKRRGLVWEEMCLDAFMKQCIKLCGKEECDENGVPVPERLDIEHQSGFRIYASYTGTTTAVLFQFHHSASDGIGEMEFIGDVLTDYSARFEGKTPPVIERKPELLPLRGKSGLTLGNYFRHFFDTMFTTRQLVFGRPSPLKPDDNIPARVIPDYYKFCAKELTPEESKICFTKAKQKRITVNDYLLSVLFQTIGEWNGYWVQSDKNLVYRVSVPMNLRAAKHSGIPASNTTTMIFFDRRHRHCGKPKWLLRSLRREMNWVKRSGQRHIFLLGIWEMEYLFGGLRRFLKRKCCRATAVLSNLGRVWEKLPLPKTKDGKLRVGDAVLHTVDASPPIRFGTLVSFSILTYSGRLRFTMRYDSQKLTAVEAESFLQLFCNEIYRQLQL
ncbi:MAG: hypothetical protein FWE67_04680 [Planctomycetaceae bacterium]|nr:hypothetical protein [Planctomycetaceae bacterium]